MIDDLDEALRELLIRELPIRGNEIDIAFDQPRREWASRLSRPTLNVYMHNVRENNKLRTQVPYWNSAANGNSATLTQNAVRIDVHYMITVWTNDPGDEHRLLMRTLMVLLRQRELPEDLYIGQLASQEEYGIPFKVAQYDTFTNPKEIWAVLDNEMRPGIDLVVTLAVNPFDELTVPLVRETEIGFGQMSGGFGGMAGVAVPTDRFYTVAGTIHSGEPFDHLSVQLLELSVPVIVAPNGRYMIQNLREGVYTVEVWTGQGEPVRHTISVPSPLTEYDIEL